MYNLILLHSLLFSQVPICSNPFSSILNWPSFSWVPIHSCPFIRSVPFSFVDPRLVRFPFVLIRSFSFFSIDTFLIHSYNALSTILLCWPWFSSIEWYTIPLPIISLHNKVLYMIYNPVVLVLDCWLVVGQVWLGLSQILVGSITVLSGIATASFIFPLHFWKEGNPPFFLLCTFCYPVIQSSQKWDPYYHRRYLLESFTVNLLWIYYSV